MSDGEIRRSPLDATHRALGAKMVPFGGWDMPLHYPAGTLAEHRACRTSAVVFDVSHLGTVRVTGAGAHARLQWALTNDLDRIAPGRCQYTHLLAPEPERVQPKLPLAIAAPGRDDRRTRRSALPSVIPYALSRGSTINLP